MSFSRATSIFSPSPMGPPESFAPSAGDRRRFPKDFPCHIRFPSVMVPHRRTVVNCRRAVSAFHTKKLPAACHEQTAGTPAGGRGNGFQLERAGLDTQKRQRREKGEEPALSVSETPPEWRE